MSPLDADIEDVVIAVHSPFAVEGTIQLENGDIRSVLPPRRVTLPSPTPLAFPMSVDLTRPDSSERNGLGTIANEDGTFRLLLSEPGLYRPRFAAVPPTVYVKSVLVDGQDALTNPVQIGPGSRIEVLSPSIPHPSPA